MSIVLIASPFYTPYCKFYSFACGVLRILIIE